MRLATTQAIAICLCFVVISGSTGADPRKPERLSPAAIAQRIDNAIDRGLADARIPPSPLADDAEFLRRVTLDLIGRIPTAERAAAFLADERVDKRARLVEELLASPEYGRNFATLWQNRIGRRSGFTEGGDRIEYSLFPWLADQFNRNRPWSEMVAAMLSASGPINKDPATGFYLAEANTTDGVVQAERVTGMVSQLFLGVNLRCAQCHNHPFAKWKQTDFWGMAVFFGRIGYTTKPTYFKILTESKDIRNKDDQPIPSARADATIVIPGKGKVARARFLDGTAPDLDPKQPFRLALSAWVTSPDNKLFARAAVNRTWDHFFGRGLVEPVDDVTGGDSTHAQLFDELAQTFSASGHDLKNLIRAICLSKTYQRTSRPLTANRADAKWYSHMPLRQLRSEPLADSLMLLVDNRDYEKDLMAPLRDGGRCRLVEMLNGDADPKQYGHSIPQKLTLMNSNLMGYRKSVVTQALSKKSWEQALEHLYLGVLARKPEKAEVALFTRFRDRKPNVPRDQLYDQMAWALMNSSEFLFNH